MIPLSLTYVSRIFFINIEKPDNDLVVKEKGRQTVEYFTQAICRSHIVYYMHPEIPAGLVR